MSLFKTFGIIFAIFAVYGTGMYFAVKHDNEIQKQNDKCQQVCYPYVVEKYNILDVICADLTKRKIKEN